MNYTVLFFSSLKIKNKDTTWKILFDFYLPQWKRVISYGRHVYVIIIYIIVSYTFIIHELK